MSVTLPTPVPLPDPPGSAEALGSVLGRLDAAGYAAGLTVHLLEPAGEVVGWQGADAAVALAEVGAATGVAVDLHAAVTAARARLADHHELWLAVLARVVQLRAEQRAGFGEAGARLAVFVGVPLEVGGVAAVPEAVVRQVAAVVAAVAAEDAARGAEHRALLAALAEDAAGVAAVLAALSRPFGGSGRPGEAAAVTAGLAVRLPGWGAGALATLGARAADELTGPGTGADLGAAVARWRPYLGLPGFTEALVGRLGADGVTWLLSVLAGSAGTEEEMPLAGLLAVALGGPSGRIEQVLDGVGVDVVDPDGAVDGIAVAMGLVLAAPGAGPALAARWGRQLLVREAAQGARAGASGTGAAELPDPVDAALAVLAGAGDPTTAAQLLADPGVWRTLLSRPWPGGTDTLAALIDGAAAAPAAGPVARAVLVALGEGLAPGSAVQVLDDSGALSRVRDELTGLVAGQPAVVLPVLSAAGTGAGRAEDGDAALRGLGYLAAGTSSAGRLTDAVQAALRTGAAGAVAAEVAGAQVAVLEYGQRLRYALAWAHEQSRAVDAQILWELGVSQPLSLLTGRVGEVLDVIEDPVADFFDANGDVEIGPDRGRVRTADDAARLAATLGPAAPGTVVPSGAAARAGFARAGDVLGSLVAPGESLRDRFPDVSVPDLSSRRRRGG